MKKKILAIGLVVCMLVVAIGSATMAYFTDTESANNVMTVGKIDIVQHETDADGNPFEDGQHLLPNVTIEKVVTVENTGNSDAYFRTFVAFEGNKNFVDTYLAENIDKHDDLKQYGEIQIGASTYTLYIYTPSEALAARKTSAEILTSFTLSEDATQEDVAFAGDEYNVWVVTEAVQADGFADAETALNTAFGTLGAQAAVYTGYHPFGDTSWYNDTATEFTLTDRADLLGFAALVNGGVDTFEGKIVKLGADIDLSDIEWAPIGVYAKRPFAGTFDGQNHTISNMMVSGTDFVGLFGYVKKDGANHAAVKDVVVDHATISGTHYAGGIVAHGFVDVTGCKVTNSEITLSAELIGTKFDNGDKAGGIIGYVGESTYQITGNTVSNVKITGYRDLGGIAGYAQAQAVVSNNTVENVTITVDYSNNYKNYAKADEFDAEAIVGEGPVGGGNTATNVTIVVPDAVVSTAAQLQAALDNAVNGDVIILTGDITGDVTVEQKENVKFTIEGNGHEFNGAITVDGKSKRYETAGLTIQNVNFAAGTISKDAYINLGAGDNNTRYTNHVTVSNCTFTYTGEGDKVAIKSYTGGDKNLTVEKCTVDSNMHSLLQVTNVEEGLTITGCKVYSKNGINLNNTLSLTMSGCEFDTVGYAVRFGVNGNTLNGTFKITDSTLQSDCDDGDAVIIFRGNVSGSTLTLVDTTVDGSLKITNQPGTVTGLN